MTNITFLPRHVNNWKSQPAVYYHVNYCAFHPNSRGAFYPKYTILLHNSSIIEKKFAL